MTLSLKDLVHKGIFLGCVVLIDTASKEKFLCEPKINLETAVGGACMVQSIDLSGVTGEIAVTSLVIRLFPVMPGESMGCVRCVPTTAVSRIIDFADHIYCVNSPSSLKRVATPGRKT